MKSYEELRESLEALVLQYKTNTEKCSAVDLAGRYRVAYESLKKNISETASQMIKIRSYLGFLIVDDENGKHFVDDIERMYARDKIGEQIGEALFKRYSIPEAETVMDGLRIKVRAMHREYLKNNKEAI